MTQQAELVVAAFDLLPPKEQREVAEVLLKKVLRASDGPNSDEFLVEAAESLFLNLEPQEAILGQSQTR